MTEERNRARLAYCLTQWKRPHGGDIPQSEAGIAEHERLVEDYEIIYGPANPNSLRLYDSVYAGIRAGAEADQDADEAFREHQRQEAARKDREKTEARERKAAMVAQQQREDANRVLSMNARTIPLLEMQVERLSQYVDRDAARVKQLEGLLASERYAHLWGEIQGNLEDVEERLTEYRGRLAKFEEDVADAEAECDHAHEVLALEDPAEGGETELTIRWRRKSNGFYHPYGREDRAALAQAGFHRAMGDAMVVAPDGRVKAWRTDGARTEKRVNGIPLVFEPTGPHLLAKLVPGALTVMVEWRA